jgi:hypothetical protein
VGTRAAPGSELLEVLTVGFPFCTFKAGVGLWALGRGWTALAAPLLVLAAADAVLNAVNLGALLALRRRVVSACVLSAVTLRWSPFPRSTHAWLVDFGNSLDVALSFALVAGMVGSGGLGELPAPWLRAWNAAVVLNVLGAGLGRMGSTLERLPR